MKMELWFTEIQNPNMKLSYKINKIYHTEETPYQKMAIVESEQYGKMMVLDEYVMFDVTNEFVYHEMMAHVPLFTHPNPERVVVIGGGDGGVIREIVKHPQVKKVTLVEIDKRVVEVSKEHFPSISCELDNSKVEVLYEDGIKYIEDHKNEFDVVMIDSTDPIGPAVGLFQQDFYKSIYESLKPDGIMVAQTESPIDNRELVKSVNDRISAVYPITKLYTAYIPMYPTGMWTFTIGSKKYNPQDVDVEKIKKTALKTKYFNEEIFKACFMLPNFLRDLLK